MTEIQEKSKKFVKFEEKEIARIVYDYIEEEVVNIDLHRDDVIADYAKETAMKYFLNHFEKSRRAENAPKREDKMVVIADV